MQRVWQRLAYLSLGAQLGQVPLVPPAGLDLAAVRQVVPELRWHGGLAGRRWDSIAASPTWL